MNFLNDERIINLTNIIKKNRSEKKYVVSDIIIKNEDDEELQFVDLVMEGGGTLGIALVGYIYALEQAGIRFLSVGGSSVGAIVSLLLVSLGNKEDEKAEQLAELISSMDMVSFIDGTHFPKKLSNFLGSGNAFERKFTLAILTLLSSKSLCKKLGLNPGNEFLNWLTKSLETYNIKTYGDIEAIMQLTPTNIVHRYKGIDYRHPKPSLKIVSADLTTTTKVIFPEMGQLYWENTTTINPALFARASMSIPLFFQPMVVSGISEIKDINKRWEEIGSFSKPIPNEIMFTDGGLISNFPISLFHLDGVPNAPTFGVKLGTNQRHTHKINSLFSYFISLLDSLRHDSDFEFIYNNPDYKNLITYVNTYGHNWLNFNMDDEEKIQLFKKGMESAIEFLNKFDWEKYKKIREYQHKALIK